MRLGCCCVKSKRRRRTIASTAGQTSLLHSALALALRLSADLSSRGAGCESARRRRSRTLDLLGILGERDDSLVDGLHDV